MNLQIEGNMVLVKKLNNSVKIGFARKNRENIQVNYPLEYFLLKRITKTLIKKVKLNLLDKLLSK